MIHLGKIISRYGDESVLKKRNNTGINDLLAKYGEATPITNAQKEEIVSFWRPYLKTRWDKKSFDIRWFDVYNTANLWKFDLKYYIPDSYYYVIIDSFFSNRKESVSVDDKNLYDLYFHDIIQPKTIIRKTNGVLLDSNYKLINDKTACALCETSGEVIVKPAVQSAQGRGISYWRSVDNTIDELKEILAKNANVIVQEVVKQHPVLALLSHSCVNTLRLVSLLFKEEVHIVASVVIMGGKNSKTNHLHGGGSVCGVLPTGELRDTAFDGHLHKYNTSPDEQVLKGIFIPSYTKCIDVVKLIAPRLSRISKLISWDFTINTEGDPVLIETNLSKGGSVQIASGPVFGHLTKEVLDFIVKNR